MFSLVQIEIGLSRPPDPILVGASDWIDMITSTGVGKVVRKKAAPPEKPAAKKRGRDPEDRVVDPANSKATREKMLDKTIADSFPASDAPSSLPNPSEDSFSRRHRKALQFSKWRQYGGRRSEVF